MQQQEIRYLLQQHMAGTLSPAGTEQLRAVLSDPANEALILQCLQQLMEESPELESETGLYPHMLTNILSVDKTGTGKTVTPVITAPKEGLRILIGFRWQWAAAAIVALTLLAAGWFFVRKKTDGAGKLAANHAHEKTSIVPGSNRAVLTLADGSQITLTDAENGLLSQQGATRVVKTDSGRLAYYSGNGKTTAMLNTISTPRGGQYQVTLPDATKVWLNAASSLRFPTAFTGNERQVELTGEAYFEVAQNSNMPFVVKAGQAQVNVLGTHFNIMAYDDEKAIQTTLLEGAVKMSMGQQAAILKPGQQGGYDKKTGNLSTREVNTNEAIAWKEGYYLFNRTDIPTIMRQIARWYDVDVVYEGAAPKDEIVGKISRTANVSDVLHIMELIGIHFRINGRTITVLS